VTRSVVATNRETPGSPIRGALAIARAGSRRPPSCAERVWAGSSSSCAANREKGSLAWSSASAPMTTTEARLLVSRQASTSLPKRRAGSTDERATGDWANTPARRAQRARSCPRAGVAGPSVAPASARANERVNTRRPPWTHDRERRRGRCGLARRVRPPAQVRSRSDRQAVGPMRTPGPGARPGISSHDRPVALARGERHVANGA
jgi:hypothetical protein